MKRNLLFMSVLASLFMAGCSQDDGITPKDELNGNGETMSHYMAVNFVSSDNGDLLTRAKSGFEDGSETENNITGVRFYFFNGVGGQAAVKVLGDQYVNYYDWKPDSQSADANGGDDIEKKFSALIVISTKEGDEIPQMMAAVLNPTEELKAKGSQSLVQLREIADDYAKAELTTSGKFVMFNSVYSQNKNTVDAVQITADNLATSEDAAKTNPVKLYVERSVAKVSVEIGIQDDDDYDPDQKLLKLKDKDGESVEVDGGERGQREQVYLKLEKWGLTAETNKGRLVKKINPGWTESWIQEAQGQYLYRSCWGINVMDAKNIYNNNTHEQTEFGGNNYLYTNENAQLDDIDNKQGTARERTKVKINGRLCKSDGTPITLVRHLGSHFVDTYNADESQNLNKLKQSILSQLDAAGKKYYTMQEAEGSKKFTQIATEDLKIVIADQQEKEETGKNCYVYAVLTEDAQAKTWYSSDDPETYERNTVDFSAINADLKNDDLVDKALVWREGMTYYYYEIIHHYTPDQQGVVRNHVYKTKITGIAGLGTPVYDPEQTIYPEKPEDNDHYIAAEINILSWHIVNGDYNLKW